MPIRKSYGLYPSVLTHQSASVSRAVIGAPVPVEPQDCRVVPGQQLRNCAFMSVM
jgi:hypothetical protein